MTVKCKILKLRTKQIGRVVFRQAGLDPHTYTRPVYIESRVCVVKEAVMCSFEY